mmetsp:Transcript_7684/g.15445  ORF Transcript_7684/g.15445 Transcript_7684/m.15445 type:complete len:134 (+) Transcript_7684:992-1393(+)
MQSDEEQMYLDTIASLKSHNSDLLTQNKVLQRTNEAILSENLKVKSKQDDITLLRQEITKLKTERGRNGAVTTVQATVDATNTIGDQGDAELSGKKIIKGKKVAAQEDQKSVTRKDYGLLVDKLQDQNTLLKG